MDYQACAVAPAPSSSLSVSLRKGLASVSLKPIAVFAAWKGEPGTLGHYLHPMTDRVVAAQHAWLSPLPPEGASAILYRTTERAMEVAERQGVGVATLRAHRIVDRVIPEHPDAADEGEAFLRRVGAVLEAELGTLLRWEASARYGERRRRYRMLGRL